MCEYKREKTARTLQFSYMIYIIPTENCKSKMKTFFQDHVFRIDPAKVEDGKGKSPYDPRHNAASVLVGKLQRNVISL